MYPEINDFFKIPGRRFSIQIRHKSNGVVSFISMQSFRVPANSFLWWRAGKRTGQDRLGLEPSLLYFTSATKAVSQRHLIPLVIFWREKNLTKCRDAFILLGFYRPRQTAQLLQELLLLRQTSIFSRGKSGESIPTALFTCLLWSAEEFGGIPVLNTTLLSCFTVVSEVL